MTRLLLALLGFYKRWLSPALHSLAPGGCKFLPTCSDYAAAAFALHGPWRGGALAAWRLLRCHPFSRGGLDPVPAAFRGRGRSSHTAVPPAPAGQPGVEPFPQEPLP